MLEIIAKERRNGELHGVIVQFGGQTPLKLANALQQADVRSSAPRPDAIDLAGRPRPLQRLLDKLGLKQPKNGIAYSVERSRLVGRTGLPLVVRPSYVLGGRAMQIIRDEAAQRLSARTCCRAWCPDVKARLSQRQDRADQHGARQEPAAVRPLSGGRRRGGCRRAGPTRDTFVAVHHGAYRGSLHIISAIPACSLPPVSPDMATSRLEGRLKTGAGVDVGD